MLVSNGRGVRVNRARIPQLAGGTMATTDLKAARKFYEEFLCFDCVCHTPGRLPLRDPQSKRAMERGGADFFIIEVDEIAHPQSTLNHWGFAVKSIEEVDRIRAAAIARKDESGSARYFPSPRYIAPTASTSPIVT